MAAQPDENAFFVLTSRIHACVGHSDLAAAFRDRSGVVDGVGAFGHLEVWRQRRHATGRIS